MIHRKFSGSISLFDQNKGDRCMKGKDKNIRKGWFRRWLTWLMVAAQNLPA